MIWNTRSAAAVCGLVLSGACGAQCDEWIPTPGDSALAGSVSDLAVMDFDGPGPNRPVLFASHSPTATEPRAVHWWNGSSWQVVPTIPSTVTALFGSKSALAGFATPCMFIGGNFTSTDGGCRRIASWNGSQVSPVGPSAEADFSAGANVRAMMEWDSDGDGPQQPWLVVGGSFTRFGGVNVSGLAAWDGTQWRALGSGPGLHVYALASWDPDGPGSAPAQLVAAVPGESRVKAWDGTEWRQLGGLFTGGYPYALASHDADGEGPEPATICVGGDFAAVGGVSAPRVARWDGTQWLPAATNNPYFWVIDLRSLDLDGDGIEPPKLVAAGTGGASVLEVSGWVTHPYSGGSYGTAAFDPDGDGPRGVELVAGFSSSADGVKAWSGSAWGPLGNEFVGGKVFAFHWHDEDGQEPLPPALYACGSFTQAGGATANRLARWDGGRWVGLGTYISGEPINSLASFDPDGAGPGSPWLVGVEYNGSGRGVFRWNGQDWTLIGNSPSMIVSVATFDEDGSGPQSARLFAAGYPGLFVWAGTAWIRAGTIRSTTPYWRMFAHDMDGDGPLSPSLIAGGFYDMVGWTGFDWETISPVDAENDTRLWHMRSWDSDGAGPAPPGILFGAREIVTSDGVFHGVARFDEGRWSQVGNSIEPAVRGMGVHDPDGAGPVASQLVIGYSGHDGKGVARLQAGEWASLGAGLSGPWNGELVAHALIDVDPDGPGPAPVELWIGGAFTHAGGQPAANFARWRMNSLPPAIMQHPVPMALLAGGSAEFSLTAQADQAMTYQWRRGTQALADGPTPGGSQIEGAATSTLFITGVTLSDAGEYTCVVSTPCQSVATTPARLRVCDPDVTCDGAINGFDVLATEEAVNGDFTNFCQPTADLNEDGAENGFDIETEEQRVNGAPCG